MTVAVGVGHTSAVGGGTVGRVAGKRLFGIFVLVLLGVSFVATWPLRESGRVWALHNR